jgi:hypothetical protein
LKKTIHWFVEDNGKIVGAARLAILDDIKQTNEGFDKFELPSARPFAYWSRLVVHPAFRQSNTTLQLDHVRKKYIIDNPEIKFAICCITPERHNAIFSYRSVSSPTDIHYMP